jgi:hypothetical protein
MSWLFGYKKPVSDLPPQGSGGSGDGSPPSGNSGNDKPSVGKTDPKAYAGRESVYKFDSSALERAAHAAKELERSRKLYTSKSIDSTSLSLSFQHMPVKHLMLLKCKSKLNNLNFKNK